MWLKRHKPDTWHRAGYFFDLADFLLWRASGSTARSQCTLTCKWTYLAHEQPAWQESFFAAVGIPEIIDRGALPSKASPIGMSVGPLTKAAAAELGLTVDCQVGVGLIDAHAGALGLLGALASDESAMESHLGVIAGTSTCVMALSPQPRPTPGVWGPYFGAVLPALWLNEGGQSATGALLDHIIANHAAGGEPSGDLHRRIVERIAALRAHDGPDFAGRLHVLPDFHGNRSPLADPHALGVISGLSLDSSFDSLCRLYWRTAVAIALGLRHIIEALDQQGFRIATLHVTGGHARSGLLLDLYADATGCTVIDYPQSDCVLLGTSMAAASACRLYPSLAVACRQMRQQGVERKPDRLAASRFDRDYRIFLEMHKHRRILEEWSQEARYSTGHES
jgi:FGGY-family pentulose kinase